MILLGLSLAASATERDLLPADGQVRPAIALTGLDGVPRNLEQMRGRVALVHFFATWCEPCREELVSLTRLEEARGHAVSVLAINVAEVPARVKRFLETAPVSFPVLLDQDRAVTKAWNVSVLPTTFVLDRDLKSRLFVEGDIDWLRPDVLAALERVGAGTSQ